MRSRLFIAEILFSAAGALYRKGWYRASVFCKDMICFCLEEQFTFLSAGTSFFQHGVDGCLHYAVQFPGRSGTDSDAAHAGDTGIAVYFF